MRTIDADDSSDDEAHQDTVPLPAPAPLSHLLAESTLPGGVGAVYSLLYGGQSDSFMGSVCSAEVGTPRACHAFLRFQPPVRRNRPSTGSAVHET